MDNTFFVGRLATYKYYNMDQVVAQALTLFKKLAPRPVEYVNGHETTALVNGQKFPLLKTNGIGG